MEVAIVRHTMKRKRTTLPWTFPPQWVIFLYLQFTYKLLEYQLAFLGVMKMSTVVIVAAAEKSTFGGTCGE